MKQGPIIGVLLAGGRSSRLGGGDKCLLTLGGKPLLARAIERLKPQVDAMVLNVNGDPSRFAAFGLPTVADEATDFAGPLAGILAGLEWTSAQKLQAPFIVTVATDAPFFPLDLVERLVDAERAHPGHPIVASSAAGEHPVFGLWPLWIGPQIKESLAGGRRKVLDFAKEQSAAAVYFEPVKIGGSVVDPFFNINEAGDLAAAERLVEA
jgi:molybdopterin-guanine dinucleotide biosynthesis protein A